MKQYPFTYIRGGTSRAAFFRKQDLPGDQALWPAIFRGVLGIVPGEPGALGQALPTGKVAVISPCDRDDADVEYHFFQVDPRSGFADPRGSCGNMASAVGPFAVDEGMVAAEADGEALVRIYHTNTGRIIESRVEVRDGRARVQGDQAIAGVPGTGSPVRLDFLSPGGGYSGRIFPTGNRVDRLALPGGGSVEATVIDCGNPSAIVRAEDLGLTGYEISYAEVPGIGGIIEGIRGEAARVLGLVERAEDARVHSTYIPQVAVVALPGSYPSLNGTAVEGESMDICLRAIFTSLHPACPVTTGIATAAACRLEGTVAWEMARRTSRPAVRIGHPSGCLEIGVEVDGGGIRRCSIVRTARRLFDGVLYLEQE